MRSLDAHVRRLALTLVCALALVILAASPAHACGPRGGYGWGGYGYPGGFGYASAYGGYGYPGMGLYSSYYGGGYGGGYPGGLYNRYTSAGFGPWGYPGAAGIGMPGFGFPGYGYGYGGGGFGFGMGYGLGGPWIW